ncbi:TolC family outer membrane protein [Rhodobacter ferrooxidans]|uniref:Type I secretion outer membrane protein, TolC family n=1 Tax=Rhodobacter ferrooxidans TaxID=371731 RepID=C8RYY4_9RHOB|nr:TolC family outer membrane protein [Rhodobacter sp. SW2]EEW25941.1 type I secretion outer membrane protein, TolC family [Rhodobacter sp. SW2]
MGVFGKRFVAAVALALLVTAPAARAETLADALIAAYRNSNLLDQNRALLRASDEDVAVAVSAVRPVIDFTLQSSWSKGQNMFGTQTENLSSSASLSAELMLLDFGRNALAIESAKETVLATREALVGIEQNVLAAAVQAYVNVRLAQEIVALRESNVRLITQELRAANDRFDVGEITRTDVAIAESRRAASQANLSAAQGDYLVAREAYKAATGAYPGNLAPLPRAPAIPGSLDEARAIALRSHPQVRQAQHQALVADLNVKRGEAAMRPTLSARAAVGLDDSGADSQSVTLSLNQTLYAGGRTSALYRQAMASRDATRAGLHQTGVIIEQNVGNAWSALQVAGASISATDLQIRAAQTAFDGLREEAKLGARTTLDVLNAEQDLLDARNARLSAEATRYYGVYALLQSMGLLTVQHLQLGIPTYDVSAYYNAVKSAPATSAQGAKLDRILRSIGGN